MTVDTQASAYRNQALLVARLLIALLFLVAAYNKITGFAGTAGYFGSLGFPLPNVFVALVVIFELAAAIMLIAGYRTRLAALLIAGFVVASAVIGHMNIGDGNQLNHFLKNLAIAGGCLALFVTGPGRFSVDER